MASCVDVPRWANFRGHTCADYLAFNWCAGGRVLNASATGAIFGRPEWACCTCGAASAADVRAAGAVTNLFFIATHEVEDVDVRLFRYYQRALDCAEPRDKPHCAAVGRSTPSRLIAWPCSSVAIAARAASAAGHADTASELDAGASRSPSRRSRCVQPRRL